MQRMSSPKRRLDPYRIALFAAVMLAGTVAALAWPRRPLLEPGPIVVFDEVAEHPTWVGVSPNSAHLARQRRILREIDALGEEHPWAGRYVASSGYEAQRLMLAPINGAHVQLSSDVVGSELRCDYAVGERADGDLQLTALRHPDPCAVRVGTMLRPVRWGQRRYLVEAGLLAEFVERMSLGLEPREELYEHSGVRMEGLALLREGDEEKTVEGLPDLPANVLAALHRQPEPVAVISVAPSASPGANGSSYRWRLRAGSSAGLHEGERLRYALPGCGEGTMTVTSTEAIAATAYSSARPCLLERSGRGELRVLRAHYDPWQAQKTNPAG
ncbi:hypothetical protein K4L06_12665 [Lysobacter sp. BMK333-48F3]|uniref:hypothetical protein n=1 Tax=Lysobacter sp. BMK333-48F3 TaxID=2867962 RepID=UPI001C8B6096|nr:hypothetical protein [Lysobacter sp. BMK333-48F3]MBX9402159.1 hypothetical protein [Lysobacter sp. BMK333-48F3]